MSVCIQSTSKQLNRPKFRVGPNMTRGKVYETSKLGGQILENSCHFFENAPIRKDKSAKIGKLFKMADFQSNS